MNAAPKDVDDQEVPKKLQRMFRLKEEVRQMKKERRRKRAAMSREEREEEKRRKEEERSLIDSTRLMG